MGMYDQSWCSSCKARMLYTEDKDVTCYRCDQEEYNKLETKYSRLLEHVKQRITDLEQAIEDANNDIPIQEDEYYESDTWYEGAISELKNLLENFGAK